MDCHTFLKVLDLYEQLQNLTKSPQMIASNHQKIEKLSNDIQMYSTFDGISKESCQSLDSSVLETINQKVEATESSLGKSQSLIHDSHVKFNRLVSKSILNKVFLILTDEFKNSLDECRNEDTCNDLAVSSVKIEIVESKGKRIIN